jgi:hypothetical protein
MTSRKIKPAATGRMTRREHNSRASAIREAVRHGYWDKAGIRADGIYILTDGKNELAIQRETRARSVVFHLVEAPPPGFITAAEVEAEKRAEAVAEEARRFGQPHFAHTNDPESDGWSGP